MADYIYLGLGIIFGGIIVLNYKGHKEQLTYEQVDEKIRTDLAMYKNLSESLKVDVAYLKQQLANERAKHVKS